MATKAVVVPLPADSTLAALDALADGFLARAEPVMFTLAANDAEREATYRMRYEAIIKHGWKQLEELPGGLERDVWDDDAVHIIGRHGTAIIASCRVVFPSPGRRLPLEEGFDLIVEPAGHVVDVGRTAVVPRAADRQHRLFAGLLGRAWIELRARGFNRLVGDLDTGLLRVYRHLRIPLETLGPARPYWGKQRYPCCIAGRGHTMEHPA